MKKLKVILVLILLIIFLIIVAINILALINPLRKSQAGIEKDILKLTPMGMQMDDVIKTIEGNEEWKVRYISYERGYMHPYRENHTVGNKSIRASIGVYKAIFIPVYVTVLWGFDENGKLIEIYVWKDFDVI
jgi:hypothetical protein